MLYTEITRILAFSVSSSTWSAFGIKRFHPLTTCRYGGNGGIITVYHWRTWLDDGGFMSYFFRLQQAVLVASGVEQKWFISLRHWHLQCWGRLCFKFSAWRWKCPHAFVIYGLQFVDLGKKNLTLSASVMVLLQASGATGNCWRCSSTEAFIALMCAAVVWRWSTFFAFYITAACLIRRWYTLTVRAWTIFFWSLIQQHVQFWANTRKCQRAIAV